MERPLAVKPLGPAASAHDDETLVGPVFTGMRIGPQRRQCAAIDRLNGGALPHRVEFGIHALHLADAPAHQDSRPHQSKSQGEYRHLDLRIAQRRTARRRFYPKLGCGLKPVTRPDGPYFKRRNHVFRKAERRERTGIDAKGTATEQAAVGGHERRVNLVAEAFAQRRAQIADGVHQAEVEGAPAGPVFPGEQGLFRTGEFFPRRDFTSAMKSA